MGYALCAIGIARAPIFAVALLAAVCIGFCDAVATTLRQVVVQIDTPDRLRGRVTAAYQMVSRGGPSLGQAQMGALAASLGAPLALTVGAAVTVCYSAALSLGGRTIRDYERGK
jgi:MFS family permease